MTRWRMIPSLIATSALLVGTTTAAGAADGSRSSATASPVSTSVGSLKVHVPLLPEFVVHGTMPIAPEVFRRSQCPFVIVDPDGTPLNTQWELVARQEDFMIVELAARVPQNRWKGEQVFDIVRGTNDFTFDDFDSSVVQDVTTPGRIEFVVTDQTGAKTPISLSGFDADTVLHRLGPAMVTVERTFQTSLGGLQVWMTARAGSPQIELIVNWHNGGLPAQPDVYFRQVELVVPGTSRWTPLMPDPIVRYPLLVEPDDHILPQRMERSFRVTIHPQGALPNLSLEGWGVGDWSGGGYMAQAVPLPNLDHTNINLRALKDDDYFRLKFNLQTVPGAPPVSPLWPAKGVTYGGMTGGVDINQYPFVTTAVTGQPEGLLSAYVEQLRYASRHMGCIYEADGKPVALENYENPDGSAPWNLFNNVFLKNQDQPFYFSQTGPGVGQSSYDPRLFDPIDAQHLVRRVKANKTLAWLDNDPLAKLYVSMDAELGRMMYHDGPGGRLVLPATPALGVGMGRGEAWVGEVVATAYALADDAWRQRTLPWIQRYRDVLVTAQMPNKLFGALDTGRVATQAPYGNGTTAFYWVHRTNEQIYLMLALRGIQESVGIDTSSTIRDFGNGIWNFAWKPGTSGTLERYPAGPIGGPRYGSRSQIPTGLTDSVPPDSFQVATALAHGWWDGAAMVPALLAYTGTPDVTAAYNKMLGWGSAQIDSRAPLLAILQQTFNP